MRALVAKWSSLLPLMLLTLTCLIGKGEGQSSAMSVNLCAGCKSASQSHRCTNNKNEAPNDWRGIVPLHSTREDVELLLGKPQWSHGATSIYDSECERVNVLYSKGICELSGVERWKVPKDTVIWLEVAPAIKLFVKDLKLDPNRYVRQPESHPANWVEYRSVEDGIRVRAMLGEKGEKEEQVLLFTYEPRKEDKDLRCSNTK